MDLPRRPHPAVIVLSVFVVLVAIDFGVWWAAHGELASSEGFYSSVYEQCLTRFVSPSGSLANRYFAGSANPLQNWARNHYCGFRALVGIRGERAIDPQGGVLIEGQYESGSGELPPRK